jgi:hypothetical protein
MTKFTREPRYIVIKVADTHFLPQEALEWFSVIVNRIDIERRLRGKDDLKCVVVEHDWPEYEPTWKAIEARMTGVQPAQQERSCDTCRLRFTSACVDCARQRKDNWAPKAELMAQPAQQEPAIYVHNEGTEVWGAKANPGFGNNPNYTAYYKAPQPAQQEQVARKLVPAIATPEMIEAAEGVEDLYRRGTPETWGKVYRAMLAAAPQPAPKTIQFKIV